MGIRRGSWSRSAAIRLASQSLRCRSLRWEHVVPVITEDPAITDIAGKGNAFPPEAASRHPEARAAAMPRQSAALAARSSDLNKGQPGHASDRLP
jgi:hypothetical protein